MLERLEKGIKELVSKYENASIENSELRDGLNMRELEIKGLKKKLEKLNTERVIVRDKIDTIINHVEGLVAGT